MLTWVTFRSRYVGCESLKLAANSSSQKAHLRGKLCRIAIIFALPLIAPLVSSKRKKASPTDRSEKCTKVLLVLLLLHPLSHCYFSSPLCSLSSRLPTLNAALLVKNWQSSTLRALYFLWIKQGRYLKTLVQRKEIRVRWFPFASSRRQRKQRTKIRRKKCKFWKCRCWHFVLLEIFRVRFLFLRIFKTLWLKRLLWVKSLDLGIMKQVSFHM